MSCTECGAIEAPVPASNRTRCSACAVGHIGARGLCFGCRHGTEPDPDRRVCVSCPPGFAGLDGVCTKCDVGFAPNADQSACMFVACALWQYLDVPTATCIQCPDGTQVGPTGYECEPCPPAQAGIGGMCHQCESGTMPSASLAASWSGSGSWNGPETNWSLGPSVDTSASWSDTSLKVYCGACPSGTAGVDGRCVRCLPGSAPNIARSACERCSAGTASAAGHACLQCQPGYGVGLNSNGSRCELCSARRIGVAGICVECPSGKEPDSQHRACTSCSPGAAGLDGECKACAPGREPAAGSSVCAQCGKGLFKPPNATSCQPCWADSVPDSNHSWCVCERGFEALQLAEATHARVCLDTDECSRRNGGCDITSKCANHHGGRTCGKCPPGFLRLFSPDYTEEAGLGNTTCVSLIAEPGPVAGYDGPGSEFIGQVDADQIEALTPEINLTVVASLDVLDPASRARASFIDTVTGDLMAALGLRADEIVITSLDLVDRRRLQEDTGRISVGISFVLRSPHATAALSSLQTQLRDPQSLLRQGTVTSDTTTDSLVLRMVCAPGLISFGTACTTCPLGRSFSTDVYGDRSCQLCPAGSHRSDPLALVCSACPLGQQPNADLGASECEPCSDSSFSATGQRCDECPAVHSANNARTQCLCAVGAFNTSLAAELHCQSLDGPHTAGIRQDSCQECPVTCYDCSSGQEAIPRPGYWGAVDTHLYECPRGTEACLGGVDTPCNSSAGFAGVTCASCGADWMMVNERCQRCDNLALRLVISIFAALGILFWAVRIGKPSMRQTNSYSATLRWERQKIFWRVLISHLQLQSMISHFSVVWPAPAMWTFTLQGLMADPSAILSFSQCAFNSETPFALRRSFLVLWVVPTAILCGTCMARVRQRRKSSRNAYRETKPVASTSAQKVAAIFERYDTSKDGILQRAELDRMAMELEGSDYDEDAWTDLCAAVGVDPAVGLRLEHLAKQFELSGGDQALDHAYQSLFPNKETQDTAVDMRSVAALLLFVSHPAMFHEAVASLSCRSLDEQLSILIEDPGVECGGPLHASARTTTILGSLIFVVGLPAFYTILCRRGWHEKALRPLCFGWHRPEYELVVSARKCFMAVVAVNLRHLGGMIQALTGLVIVQVAIIAHWNVQPSLSSRASKMEFSGLMVSWVTLLSALITALLDEDASSGLIAHSVVAGLCVAANLYMVLCGLCSFRRRCDAFAPGCLCCRGGRGSDGKGRVSPLSLSGVAQQPHAPPAMKVVSMLQEQVAAAARMPELKLELSTVLLQLERIGTLAQEHGKTAEGLHIRTAALRQISLDDNRSLLPKSARRYITSEPEKPGEVSKSPAPAKAPSKSSAAAALRRPPWYAGVDQRARVDALRSVFSDFCAPNTTRLNGLSLWNALGAMGHGPFTLEEIKTVVRSVSGDEAGKGSDVVSVDAFVKAVVTIADRPRLPLARTKEADAETEPDWSCRFVVGKLLAQIVDENPTVLGNRAGQAALDKANKSGKIEQQLASSPFWSMKPNELRHLLRSLGSGPHSDAADKKHLKSQLIRFVVESEIFNEARSRAVQAAAQKDAAVLMTVHDKAAAAAAASQGLGAARALAGTARAMAAEERRLQSSDPWSSEEDTPRASTGRRTQQPRGSAQRAQQALAGGHDEVVVAGHGSSPGGVAGGSARMARRALSRVPVPRQLK